MFIIVVLLIVSSVLYLFLECRKPIGFPPGPTWWPIVGSAIEVARLRRKTGYLYDTFNVLCKKYGPVFSIKIGKDRIVVLNDLETIRSMLTNEICDGRPTGIFYETRTWGERKGVLLTDGPLWMEQRRFIIRHLREFGLGRKTMSSMIEDEASYLVDHFKMLIESKSTKNRETKDSNSVDRNYENTGQIYQLTSQIKEIQERNKNVIGKIDESHVDGMKSKKTTLRIDDIYVKPETYDEVRKLALTPGIVMPMHDAFGVSVLNGLWRMMAGKRYSNEDKELIYFQKILTNLLRDVDMVGCLFSHFPILRFIAPEMSGYKKFLDVHRPLWTFFDKELQNHKATFDAENPRGLMDVYLNILQSNQEGSFSESQLLATCMDLFMAGSETTSKVLGVCFLHLMINREKQMKAQREIDTIVGNDRLPALSDRPRMPYVEAIVLESLRVFMGSTISIPHRALSDTEIGGYHIPKDTMLVANFPRVLMDDFWGDPEVFRPERFINESGTIIALPNQYIPFSYGKHRCPGEGLAKSNMFIVISALLQSFTFSVVPGEKEPTTKLIDGATPSPVPYRALVTLRIK